MTRIPINPQGLVNTLRGGYSQAVLYSSDKALYVSGQVAWDVHGKLVGEGDLIMQLRQALRNVSDILTSVGASPGDVIHLRTYIVNYSVDWIGLIGAEFKLFYGTAMPGAATLIGVQALALPGLLVEVEAIASVK